MRTRHTKRGVVVIRNEAQEILLDYIELRKVILVLLAANHKLRQKMVDLLHENVRMTVTDIYIKMRLEKTVVSQHLIKLRRSGMILSERKEKFFVYGLNHDQMVRISKLVIALAEFNIPHPTWHIDEEGLQIATEMVRALAHPGRMHMLEDISMSSPISVEELCKTSNMENLIAAQHIRILQHAGFVNGKKKGEKIFLSINYRKLARAIRASNTFLKTI